MSQRDSATPTILKAFHEALGAKMAPFGGFLMPIQYSGIVREHEAVRQAAGLFDTCHMGEFVFSGPSAAADLDRIVTCDVATLVTGQCRYGLICNPEGGVIDDMIVYRTGDASFMMVVNAGTQSNDLAWIKAHLSPQTQGLDVSDETGKLDVQGPHAPAILASLLDQPIAGLGYFRFKDNTFEGAPVCVSRTGYTGEIGFELYASCDTTKVLWQALVAAGVTPAGLGARDTLRLEVGLPLYGHEMTPDRNAAESGFTSVLSLDKEFIGCDAVRRHATCGSVLTGIVLEGRRAAREGDVITLQDGAPLGDVTSGSFAPSLGCAVALGYLPREHVQEGRPVQVKTSRQVLPGMLSSTSFYKQGTVRKPLKRFLEKTV